MEDGGWWMSVTLDPRHSWPEVLEGRPQPQHTHVPTRIRMAAMVVPKGALEHIDVENAAV